MSRKDIDPFQQDDATARTASNVLDALPTANRDLCGLTIHPI
jgi:hypothetical protein